MTMSKKLIMKVFTPILTFMMALVLITTTLAWYTFVLESDPVEAAVSITATVNDGRDGYDAELLPLSDSYTLNKINDAGYIYDEYQIYYDVKIPPVGYCGQTGLPDMDTIYDMPYIYFVKVKITVPVGDYNLIDMAYVNSAKIYWEKNETSTFDQTLRDNLGSYVPDNCINYFDESGEVTSSYDDAAKLEISLDPVLDGEGNVLKPNELTYNQWKIMMLEKQSNVNGYYTFVPSTQMILDTEDEGTTDGSYVYYIGVKFHNGTNNRFAFSDTIFTGCKFNLDLKFVSSENKGIVLETKGSVEEQKAPIGHTNNTSRVDGNDWLTKYTYNVTAKAGDEFRFYNILNEAYIGGFVNFDTSCVLKKDGIEYFKAPADGDYEVIVTSFRDKYEILVKTDEMVTFVYQGDTNNWTKETMTKVSDMSGVNAAVANALSNANASKYSSKQNQWYKEHLTGFDANNYNIYKMSNVTSNKIFKFNLMSSNMDVYQNGQNDYFQIAPGKYDIYCIVPKTTSNGRVTDDRNVTVIYDQVSSVAETEQSWWLKCTTNSWTGTDNYKLTKMPGSIQIASTFNSSKTYYRVTQVAPANAKESELRYYYVDIDGILTLTNDKELDVAHHTYYTVGEVYGLSQTSFNQGKGSYYEVVDENVRLTPYYTYAKHTTYVEGYRYFDRVSGGSYINHNGDYYYEDGVDDGFDFVEVFPKAGNDVSTYYINPFQVYSEYESSKTITDASVYYTCASGSLSYINLSPGEQCNIGNADNSITFGLTSLDPLSTNYQSAGVTRSYFIKSTNSARMINENNHSYALMFYYYEQIDDVTHDASTYGYLGLVGIR